MVERARSQDNAPTHSTGRVRHSASAKAAAVARAAAPDVTVAEVAEAWGVSVSTIRRWIRDADTAATREAPSKRAPAKTTPVKPAAPSTAASVTTLPTVQATTAEPAAPAKAAPAKVAPAKVAPAKVAALKASGVRSTVTQVARPTTTDEEVTYLQPRDEVFPRLSRLTSWQRFPSLLILWSLCLFIAAVVPEDYAQRPIVLGVHIVGLVVGLGAVLVVDWHGVLWMWRLRRLPETTRLAAAAGPLIWLGLVVLMLSGALLKPDLTRPLTLLKVVLVLIVAFNGAALSALRRRLAMLPPDIDPRRLTRRDWTLMSLATAISQVGWWGAAIVGFMTSQS